LAGGAIYSPSDPFQSTENEHELNQSHREIRARFSGRYGHGRFSARFPVVAEDVTVPMNLRDVAQQMSVMGFLIRL
jgi:hypothetical protein